MRESATEIELEVRSAEVGDGVVEVGEAGLEVGDISAEVGDGLASVGDAPPGAKPPGLGRDDAVRARGEALGRGGSADATLSNGFSSGSSRLPTSHPEKAHFFLGRGQPHRLLRLEVPFMNMIWRRLASFSALAVGLLGTRAAHAAFSCDGNFPVYIAYPGAGGDPIGARCVAFVGSDVREIQWYAEGAWGAFTYRNLGDTAMGHQDPNDSSQWIGGVSSDLYGNGESAQGSTTNLTITTSTNPSVWDRVTAPAVIRIGGDWNEFWVAAGGSSTNQYTSPAPPMQTCEGAGIVTFGLLVGYPNPSQPAPTFTLTSDVCSLGDSFAEPAVALNGQLFFESQQQIATQIQPGTQGVPWWVPSWTDCYGAFPNTSSCSTAQYFYKLSTEERKRVAR
jgi:hypothetical protein